MACCISSLGNAAVTTAQQLPHATVTFIVLKFWQVQRVCIVCQQSGLSSGQSVMRHCMVAYLQLQK